jgi:signal transduction histidine kinase
MAMAEGKTYFEIEGVTQTLQGERLNILMTISFPSEAEKFRSVLVSIMDITERKRAEEALKDYSERLEEMVKERTHELEAAHEELVKREKLSVLGRLTAIVSHDLRNPLGVIRSSAYYLETKLGNADGKITKHLKRIEEKVVHCDSIVNELLEYNRSRPPETTMMELNPWIETVLDEVEIPAQVTMVRELSPDISKVPFDKEKLRRVVVNLVENAIQAVDVRQENWNEAKGPYRPQVKLVTSSVENGVSIEVEDNGAGMDEETAARAFEPLFTTKARGSGLGLAIVKKIVEEHKGIIELLSKKDRGTSVSVRIPGKP